MSLMTVRRCGHQFTMRDRRCISPRSNSVTNAWVTADDRASSSVTPMAAPVGG